MRNTTRSYRPIIGLLTFALLLIFFEASFATAEGSAPERVIEGTPVLQGIIRRVSVEEQIITVKVRKGGKISILISPWTKFIGASSLTELKRGRWVKVWYSPVGGKYRALKLELLPELGC